MQTDIGQFYLQLIKAVDAGGNSDDVQSVVAGRRDIRGRIADGTHGSCVSGEYSCLFDRRLKDIGPIFKDVAPAAEIEEVYQPGALQF